MSLPAVDFVEIAGIASEAIQLYGTPVEFVEQGQTTGRTVKSVIYKDQKREMLVQDANSTPAFALLDPTDFAFPNRPPQMFDTIQASIGTFAGSWAIVADPHPIFAADQLPIYIVELRRN
jgi:hypothetical protein